MKYQDFGTRALHEGYDTGDHSGATSVPIYGTASYEFDTPEHQAETFAGRRPAHIYSRLTNPTVAVFERKMAALENGVGAIAFSSGMGAISTVLLALLSQGDEVAVGRSLFGGTLRLVSDVLPRYGITSSFFDPSEGKRLEMSLSRNTKAVFVESLGNPAMDIPDFEGISAVCKANNLPLIVDNTVPTPVLFNPGSIGAAIVIHSTTKSITGSGSAVGGAFVDTGTFDWARYPDEQVKEACSKFGSQAGFLAHTRKTIFSNTGACMSPYHAYLHMIGIETLSLRADRHCSNASDLAVYLSDQPGIEEVRYPTLESSPERQKASKYFGGRGGGLLTIRLATKETAFRFINGLSLAKTVANLGDTRTLVIHPASTIYSGCSGEEREAAGVTDGLVRVSVGIEGIQDILTDFGQALKEAREN
jgi:O-acetylhomoserine (thiol)-lyase